MFFRANGSAGGCVIGSFALRAGGGGSSTTNIGKHHGNLRWTIASWRACFVLFAAAAASKNNTHYGTELRVSLGTSSGIHGNLQTLSGAHGGFQWSRKPNLVQYTISSQVARLAILGYTPQNKPQGAVIDGARERREKGLSLAVCPWDFFFDTSCAASRCVTYRSQPRRVYM